MCTVTKVANELSRCAETISANVFKMHVRLKVNTSLKWYYDQTFNPSHDVLGVSHRIPQKNNNHVYRLQISTLVPKILKFEKCVKSAHEMTDDVMHSTRYYLRNRKHVQCFY